MKKYLPLIIIALVAITALVRAFTIDPIRISAKQTCDAYMQGATYGSSEQQKLINEQIIKDMEDGVVKLGDKKFVEETDEVERGEFLEK